MPYWVYENIPLRRTRVHLSSCSFCQDGRGIHGGGNRPTGSWFGPFATLGEAESQAASRNRPDSRRCQECLPNAELESGDVDIEHIAEPAETTDLELDAWPWDKEEELHCSLRLRWKPLGRVVLDAKAKLKFPTVPAEAGLYRFRLRTPEGEESVYVGESDNVSRRFYYYRTPGATQPTNMRINQVMRELLARGGEISVAVARDVWIEAPQGRAKANLGRKSLRCLFENFALAVEQASEIESLNR